MFLSNFDAARQVAEEQRKDRLRIAEHHRLVRLITGDRRNWLFKPLLQLTQNIRSAKITVRFSIQKSKGRSGQKWQLNLFRTGIRR
jgi:hypothetical protein